MSHPLDPLSGDEFTAVASILQREHVAGAGGPATSNLGWRFASIELIEPSKAELRAFDNGGAPPARRAEVVCLQRASNATYKGAVSLTDDRVESFEHVPGVQANFTVDEFVECDKLLRPHPDVIGDEIRGATIEQAVLALQALARLHAQALGDEAMAQADWLNRESPMNQALIGQLYAGFLERCADAYLAAEGASDRVHGLVHGDYRLDSMLFGEPGADRPLTVVDWQTVAWGPAMTDVAYFLGCAMPDELRRDHYDALLRAYHEALGPDAPVTWRRSRRGVMAIVSSMLVERTDRGDQMFMTMLQRHGQSVLDTDALAVLPEPGVAEPLTPDPADEEAHPAGDEPLWNESWYFDFADLQQGVGGWVRLGLMPNENTTWINVLLCGPDMPTIALVDFHDTGRIELTLEAGEPLRTYTVAVQGGPGRLTRIRPPCCGGNRAGRSR